ncbi:MAG: succinylglutamate desuccinylase/aspartoacylase family protein [Myxococcota bacterium]
MSNEDFIIGEHRVVAGSRTRCRLRVSRLPTDTWLSVPVEVVHGRQSGPALWLTAAIHGDELNGVEIIRRVLTQVRPRTLRGTVIAVPIVNVFGFIEQQRYLPDRRDLNRSFPGSANGSLAARLANILLRDIVRPCTHGIDLHTGSLHRTNLPQIRANLDDPETLALARAFGTRVIKHADTRDGSLRKAAAKAGNKVLLFEGGEALRFDENAIAQGTDGVMRVLAALQMVVEPPPPLETPVLTVRKSHWLRARRAGIVRIQTPLGARVVAGEQLGIIQDTFGVRVCRVLARTSGIVIGKSLNPLVNQGDALLHVGQLEDGDSSQAETSRAPRSHGSPG